MGKFYAGNLVMELQVLQTTEVEYTLKLRQGFLYCTLKNTSREEWLYLILSRDWIFISPSFLYPCASMEPWCGMKDVRYPATDAIFDLPHTYVKASLEIGGFRGFRWVTPHTGKPKRIPAKQFHLGNKSFLISCNGKYLVWFSQWTFRTPFG